MLVTMSRGECPQKPSAPSVGRHTGTLTGTSGAARGGVALDEPKNGTFPFPKLQRGSHGRYETGWGAFYDASVVRSLNNKTLVGYEQALNHL